MSANTSHDQSVWEDVMRDPAVTSITRSAPTNSTDNHGATNDARLRTVMAGAVQDINDLFDEVAAEMA